MAWQTPKTDWQTNPKKVQKEDFNRIEGNIDFLKSDIETKKGTIVNAINTMGQTATMANTHAELAQKIKDISKDATATENDVFPGKTFYSGGLKKTGVATSDATATSGDILNGKTAYANGNKVIGSMPNYTGLEPDSIAAPYMWNNGIYFKPPKGYFDGVNSRLKYPALNHKPENIKKGVNNLGVIGTYNSLELTVSDNNIAVSSDSEITFTADYYTKRKEIRVNYSGYIRVRFDMKNYPSGYSYGRVYINGSPVGTERYNNTGGYITYTEDFAVNAGDSIQLYAKGAYSDAWATWLKNFRVYTMEMPIGVTML